ncbi:kinase-like domain-containing protein [Blakeslea trispora]|nr:kinase-like domain-containing protein [Blakeslea trispora]
MTRLGSPHEKYDFLDQIGDGSFGTVFKAQNKISHKAVAVKVMKKKYNTIEDCETQFEPKLLNLLPPHLNIVQLYDSFLSPSTCELAFVMEFMDGGNLYQLMRDRKHLGLPFTHCELRSILHQILSAVSHIHHHQIFHRDMKPENLLIDYSTKRPTIKLADFGLARELNSKPPYTEYVSTRWYRAPEVLLRSTDYSAPVDLWAIGAIFAELIMLEPLFPGESEVDQIYRICGILGSPGNKIGVVGQKSKILRPEKRPSPGFARKKIKEVEPVAVTSSTISPLDGGGEWKEGVKLAYKIGFKFPQLHPKPLETVIPDASTSMLDLIRHFLFFNPSQRRSADAALKHPFFSESDEPIQNAVPMEFEPTTPPDQPLDRHLKSSFGRVPKDITPLDLLTTPKVPYQICPDWNMDHPASRHGRLSSSRTTHVDKFLHDVEGMDANPWLTQSRPIYSSHQKVHPVTDRPSSSQNQNRYSYGAHYSHRPSTPVVEHKKNIPSSSSHTTSKRHSIRNEEEEIPRRTSAHLLHHLHHPHHNDYHHYQHRPNNGTPGGTSSFGLDRVPHYGNQLIKWAPCRFTSPMETTEDGSTDKETDRPESRQCRTPAPFSSSLLHGKYASVATVSSPTSFINNSTIRPWTPPSSHAATNREKTSYFEEHKQIWVHKSETHHATVHHRVDKYVNEGKKKDQENEDDESQHTKDESDRSNKRYICVL